MNKIKFPELLKEIRNRCLFTQDELADALEMNQASICSFETGKRIPSKKTVRRLVDFANEKAGMKLEYYDVEIDINK